MYQSGAHLRVELNTCVFRRTEEEQCREQVIQPSAVVREDDDSLRSKLERRVQSELEVGGVLGRRMTLNPYSGGSSLVDVR